MNSADEALFSAIREAELLRKRTRKSKTKQVRGTERDIIRATALAWFNNHRKQLIEALSVGDLQEVDGLYKRIMEWSHKDALRSNYVSTLADIGKLLVRLRSENVVRLSNAPPPPAIATSDEPPDFSALIQDVQMKAILNRRWRECTVCVGVGAP
jgi:hypothetical protein